MATKQKTLMSMSAVSDNSRMENILESKFYQDLNKNLNAGAAFSD